jgi:tetratricopeptide (TPR) repeat protein
MLKFLAGALICAAVFAQTKSPDLCVPPPSGTAPALPAHIMTGQGKVHFAITTSNSKAQEFFDQGLAQLHSFWAVEAERSFRQAAELDPEAAMPWWGVAMISAGDYRPRHQIEGPGYTSNPALRAKAAAERALALSANATDLEKMYIASIVARRMPGAAGPDEGYISGLRAIVAKYPAEVEARLFLSLHLMRGFELPSRAPRPDSMEAVSILRALLKEAPEHPGVHHYVIHAWEGSSFAKDAWPSCEKYAQLVTNIPHALHMPGHIYAQTGRFGDAEKSFSDAAVNELGYIHADALYGTTHHGHNVHYLSTSYAFDGKYDQAKEAARSLLEFTENPRELAQVDGNYSAHRQGWFALMRAMVLSENWDEVVDGHSLPVYDRPREIAWRHWAISLAYASKGDVAAANEEAKLMDAALRQYEEIVKKKAPEELVVARMELTGHLEVAEGKVSKGLKTLDNAAKMERKLRYSEPVRYPRPVAEALGEVALRHGKRAMAEAAFRTSLEELPGSARSVNGLRDAQRGAQGGVEF